MELVLPSNEFKSRFPIRVVQGISAELFKNDIMNDNENWHSPNHADCRNAVVKYISQLIKQRKPDINKLADWDTKVLLVSEKVEAKLYQTAHSFDEYNDTSTLTERIKLLIQHLFSDFLKRNSYGYDEFMFEDEVELKQHANGTQKTPSSASVSDDDNFEQQHGCSRNFVVKVLENLAEKVQGKVIPSVYSIDKEELQSAILAAMEAKSDDPEIVSCWCEPNQFYSWWNFSVEIKHHYQQLLQDSIYTGNDKKKKLRARWYADIYQLCEKIRKSINPSSIYKTVVDPSTAIPTESSTTKSVESSNGLENECLLKENAPLNKSTSVVYPAGAGATVKNNGNIGPTFPVKLFELVSSEDQEIIGWYDSGKSFKVKDVERFVKIVLPKHFKHNNYNSFQRQLNLYGFKRTKDLDRGVYYHRFFVEGQKDLLNFIKRDSIQSSNSSSNTGSKPVTKPLTPVYSTPPAPKPIHTSTSNVDTFPTPIIESLKRKLSEETDLASNNDRQKLVKPIEESSN